MREGIDDSRYLSQLSGLIARAKASGDREAVQQAGETQKTIDRIVNPINISEAIIRAYGSQSNEKWPPELYDQYRWQIAQQIIKLRGALKK